LENVLVYHTQKYLNKTPKLVTRKERSPRTMQELERQS
jgi:hypothetical protein